MAALTDMLAELEASIDRAEESGGAVSFTVDESDELLAAVREVVIGRDDYRALSVDLTRERDDAQRRLAEAHNAYRLAADAEARLRAKLAECEQERERLRGVLLEHAQKLREARTRLVELSAGELVSGATARDLRTQLRDARAQADRDAAHISYLEERLALARSEGETE